MTFDRTFLIRAGGAAIVVLVLLANTLYVVEQRQQALVLRFGELVRTVDSSGLKLKVPFVENVIFLDKRIVAQDTGREEIITADQQRLVVDAYVRYRITNPQQYYRTLRDETTAEQRLDTLVNSSLRQVLGSVSSDAVVARRGQLMQVALKDVGTRANEARFGITVVDVRIRRADLPDSNRDAVFNRMRTAREQEAAQIRAMGEQQKREIMATADKDVTVTLATANQQAGQIRGEGDGQRAAIFASSYGRDPGFASFYRSMRAYENALGQGDTTMVLSPDSAFFRYFERGPSGGR